MDYILPFLAIGLCMLKEQTEELIRSWILTELVEVKECYSYLFQLRVQHETYPPSYEQVCRVVVLIGEVEVRDKLANSEINKLLYQYTTEAMPRQSHASMVRM